MLKNSTGRYGSLNVALHWLMLVLMIAVYIGMECRGDFPKEIRPTLVRILHYSFGITILFLVFIRIGVRFSGPTPFIRPRPPAWQEGISVLMHIALYVFMIGMPLMAWLSYSLKGKPVWFYGMPLPPFTLLDPQLAKQLRLMHWHETIGELGYWLMSLHAGAALFHHYIVKDNTLKRILPLRFVQDDSLVLK